MRRRRNSSHLRDVMALCVHKSSQFRFVNNNKNTEKAETEITRNVEHGEMNEWKGGSSKQAAAAKENYLLCDRNANFNLYFCTLNTPCAGMSAVVVLHDWWFLPFAACCYPKKITHQPNIYVRRAQNMLKQILLKESKFLSTITANLHNSRNVTCINSLNMLL